MNKLCKTQYKYNTQEEFNKKLIYCDDKIFENYEELSSYTHRDLLCFIKKKYGDEAEFGIGAFKNKGNSPFEFEKNYINLDNEELCNPTSYSLKPQQKFIGQLMNPEVSNFKDNLIFHGLGSGKTCTAIIAATIQRHINEGKDGNIVLVVPVALIDQYYEELLGLCPEQTLILKDDGFQTFTYQDLIRSPLVKKDSEELQKLKAKLEYAISIGDQGDIRKYETAIKIKQQSLNKLLDQVKLPIQKYITIKSGDIFINELFEKDGTPKIRDKGTTKQFVALTDPKGLFQGGGLLIIDEIQRLISKDGSKYKKLYKALNIYADRSKLNLLLLSATPIYDNPYELCLIMNLFNTRLKFPTDEKDFYSYFLGKINDETGECDEVKDEKNYIGEKSCLINSNLLNYLLSGYVSYFKGGNPNAYPNKRIINLFHPILGTQLNQYSEILLKEIK